MGKGILITLLVFGVIAIIHFVSLKTISLVEKKKIRLRKIFWYVYGILFFVSGIVTMLEKEQFLIISSIQSSVGFVCIVLNFMGKIETIQK